MISIQESQVIKDARAINNLTQACKELNISYQRALRHCESKGYRIKTEYKRKHASYTIDKQALIIEDFLTGNYCLHELAEKHDSYTTRMSHVIRKYFAYKGLNKVTIVLKSKV